MWFAYTQRGVTARRLSRGGPAALGIALVACAAIGCGDAAQAPTSGNSRPRAGAATRLPAAVRSDSFATVGAENRLNRTLLRQEGSVVHLPVGVRPSGAIAATSSAASSPVPPLTPSPTAARSASSPA